MTQTLYRQGDILLESIKETVGNRSGEGERVLALGEVTGHTHVLKGNVTFFEGEDGVVTARVERKGAVLIHQEHAPIKVKSGKYRVVHQREFDLVEGVRRVQD